MITWASFLLIIILIILNGFFVTAEFSLLRLPKTRIPSILEEKKFGAKELGIIIPNLNIYITSLQIGITFSTLSLGVIGEPIFRSLVNAIFNLLGITLTGTLLRVITFTFTMIFLLSALSILGEIAPKTVSIQNIELTARLTALPTYWYSKIIKPLANLYRFTAFGLLRLARFQVEREIYKEVYTEEELKMLIHTSLQEGEINALEERMINNIFNFTERTVKEILTPRYKIKAFPIDAKKDEIIETAKISGFSRFPVYEDELDKIKGFLHIKDVILSKYDDPEFEAKQILRNVVTIHEGMRLDILLKKIQQKKSQLAIVVDEYGAIEGLVTIEDVLEEIVGPIEDEFDESEGQLIEFVDNDTYLVDANITLEEFNSTISEELMADDSITLAGFFLENLETIPEEGSRIVKDNYEFVVVEMDGNRIAKIQICKGTNGSNGEPIIPISSPETISNHKDDNIQEELQIKEIKKD